MYHLAKLNALRALEPKLSLFTNQVAHKGRQNLRGNSKQFNTQTKEYGFKENPIIFNKVNENYVIRGKEKLVGMWLLGVSASVFAIVILGGYTRLTRSGLSMVKWHPHKVGLPKNNEEWAKEFEEYKEYPEYYLVNKQKGMDVEGFKQIYLVEWAHRIVARSIGVIFLGPLAYFWTKGYLQPRLKKSLIGLLCFGGLQGVIGWWMVASGLVDKVKTNEIDKFPRVNPYKFMVHAYSAYAIYGAGIWLSLNCLRRPQEAIITLQNMAEHNAFRKIMMKTAHGLLPIILLTGFFTAGIQGRHACNTFPKVGDHWFITKNHFQSDIPLWQNFTENKLVVQVTHRTLASLFVLLAFKSIFEVQKLTHLSPIARRSFYIFLATIVLQACIGISAIWYPDPISLANLHQGGALVILTAIIYAVHTCRRVDPRHIRNLLGKLKVENPQQYEQTIKGFNKQILNKKEFEQAKQYYEK